jgi:hypothetical protein
MMELIEGSERNIYIYIYIYINVNVHIHIHIHIHIHTVKLLDKKDRAASVLH